jgi:hypothetical protein
VTDQQLDPAAVLASMPFAAGIGVELLSVGPAETVGRLAWSADRCTERRDDRDRRVAHTTRTKAVLGSV